MGKKMICPHCHKATSGTMQYCVFCGAPLEMPISQAHETDIAINNESVMNQQEWHGGTEVFESDDGTIRIDKSDDSQWLYKRTPGAWDTFSNIFLWIIHALSLLLSGSFLLAVLFQRDFGMIVVGLLMFLVLGAAFVGRILHAEKPTLISINRSTGEIVVKTDRFGVTKHKRYQLQDVSAVKYAHGGVTLEGSSVSLELFRTRRSYQERAWAHGRELAAFLNLEFVEETELQPMYSKLAATIQRLPLDQALRAILLRHLRGLVQPDIYVGSNISAGSLRTAIQHYAPGCATTEIPLLFIDASSWSTANGVLITDTHLYTRDPTTKMSLQTEIAQLTALQIYHTHSIYTDGKQILRLRLPEDTIWLIANIVSEMAAYYRRVPVAVRTIDCFVLTFGAVNITLPDSTYIFADPDFEHKETQIEISAVYLDTTTCDRLLLERFFTYIVNYPPKKGVKSVQIFYQGELDDLGENLKNALRNTFAQIDKLTK